MLEREKDIVRERNREWVGEIDKERETQRKIEKKT